MSWITKADLLETENRINREQTEARHSQNNLIQKALLVWDEAKTENKILNKTIENMNNNFQKLDKKVEWISDKIDELFKDFKKELKENYTPISEHKHNSDRIWKIEKVIYWVAGVVWTCVITAILSLVIISKW